MGEWVEVRRKCLTIQSAGDLDKRAFLRAILSNRVRRSRRDLESRISRCCVGRCVWERLGEETRCGGWRGERVGKGFETHRRGRSCAHGSLCPPPDIPAYV